MYTVYNNEYLIVLNERIAYKQKYKFYDEMIIFGVSCILL